MPRTSESDAEAGERLVALREHLLQLGATEGHLQALRDNAVELTPHTPPATPDPTRETSVVEILEVRAVAESATAGATDRHKFSKALV